MKPRYQLLLDPYMSGLVKEKSCFKLGWKLRNRFCPFSVSLRVPMKLIVALVFILVTTTAYFALRISLHKPGIDYERCGRQWPKNAARFSILKFLPFWLNFLLERIDDENWLVRRRIWRWNEILKRRKTQKLEFDWSLIEWLELAKEKLLFGKISSAILRLV